MGFKIMTADGWKEIPTNGIKPSDHIDTVEKARRFMRGQGCKPMAMETHHPNESAKIRRFKENMNRIATTHNDELERRALEMVAA